MKQLIVDLDSVSTERSQHNVVIDHESYAISFDDTRRLIDYFPYADPHRIAFIMLAVTGCRPCELGRMRTTHILEDAVGTYLMWRPGKGQKGYRKECLPVWFTQELNYYLSMHHLPEKYLFPFTPEGLRKYLNKFVRQHLGGNFLKKVLRCPTGTVRYHYMLDLKSFRHTYACKEFWERMNKWGESIAIGQVGKKMRHGTEKITSRHYCSDVEYIQNDLVKYKGQKIGEIIQGPIQTKLTSWGFQSPVRGQSKIGNY